MANNISTFDSTKLPLADLLKEISNGKTQLPDFQRGWVWDDHHIISLIESIGNAYPIGAVMSLETGNDEVTFKTRTFEGAPESASAKAERLILDGQQRLTSLYQALFSKSAVKTRNSKGQQMDRFYFIDIKKAIYGSELEDAIISVPESKIGHNFRKEILWDYSSDEKQWVNEVFPLNIIFEVSEWNTWQTGYLQAEGNEQMATRLQRWNEFFQNVLQPIQQYYVPVIELNKQTTKAAICQVFEKVNTGGVSLTVFELLTATFAIDDFNLRDDWKMREDRFKAHQILNALPNDNFLQAVALLTSYERRIKAEAIESDKERLPAVSSKRRDILRLTFNDYVSWADRVEQGFIKASQFLHTQNIFSKRDLPYATQLVPLATILIVLDSRIENDGVRQKLKQWYWSGVLGELYGSATDTRFAKDLPEVISWIEGGSEPATIREANFQPERLLSLRSRGSAAYKGVYALMLQKGALDFGTGVSINHITYFDEAVDIHHIFPKAWCTEQGISRTIHDSIINKTPLYYRTNRKIGRKAPSLYLAELRSEINADEVRQAEMLETHLLSIEHMSNDDFNSQFEQRGRSILKLISEAMKKEVQMESDQLFIQAH